MGRTRSYCLYLKKNVCSFLFVKEMSQFCFICSKRLSESDSVTVERGLKTLIDASIERGDGFSEYLKDQTSMTIHVQCRKNYTRKSTIAAVKRQHEEEQAGTSKISPPRTRARTTKPVFCFKQRCLFCGNELNEEFENKKALKYRRQICNVSTLSFKETILNIAQTRSDNVAKAIITRIQFEHDLIAAEGKYHKDCYNSFLRPTTGGNVGRPQDETTNLAMEEIFAYIENSDDCQFTLNELKDICKNSVDNRTIKLRLKLKYGDKIIITEKSGTSTFICFLDNHYDILNRASWGKKYK